MTNAERRAVRELITSFTSACETAENALTIAQRLARGEIPSDEDRSALAAHVDSAVSRLAVTRSTLSTIRAKLGL